MRTVAELLHVTVPVARFAALCCVLTRVGLLFFACPFQTSILVRNLPREVLASDVRDQFSKFGRVEDVYLPKDYYTGLPRGIAFVQFAEARDAADALQLDRSTVGGREVSVQYAEHGRKRPEQMAHRGGGGGGGGGGGPPGAYAGYGGGGYGGYGYAGYGGHGGYYGGGGAYGGAYDDHRGRDRRRRSRSRSRSRKRSESRGRDESDESRSRSRSRRRSRSRERSKRRD